jgi:hypothetical protein
MITITRSVTLAFLGVLLSTTTTTAIVPCGQIGERHVRAGARYKSQKSLAHWFPRGLYGHWGGPRPLHLENVG